jgi:hypothetical protein
MIIRQPDIAPTGVTAADLREALIELWAQVFERELRADIEAEAEASGERARLSAIDRIQPVGRGSRRRNLEDQPKG